MAYTEPVLRLIEAFAKLPGIGERTAERLTFHLLSLPKEEAMALALAVRDLKEHVRLCSTCYNTSEKDPCEICAHPKRDREVLCVVERTQDLWSIEKSGAYRGLYHVLHGHLSPLDGVGPEDLTIRHLQGRIRKGGVREVILATNPTAEGDATAFFLQQDLQGRGIRVTRIARGLPTGTSLEYANRTMVQDALDERKEF